MKLDNIIPRKINLFSKKLKPVQYEWYKFINNLVTEYVNKYSSENNNENKNENQNFINEVKKMMPILSDQSEIEIYTLIIYQSWYHEFIYYPVSNITNPYKGVSLMYHKKEINENEIFPNVYTMLVMYNIIVVTSRNGYLATFNKNFNNKCFDSWNSKCIEFDSYIINKYDLSENDIKSGLIKYLSTHVDQSPAY